MRGPQAATSAVNFIAIFDAIRLQDFSKHIRTEPCGICTETMAKMASGFQDESEYKYIFDALSAGKSLFLLPKVTNSLLLLSIEHLDNLAYHKKKSEAIEYNSLIIKLIKKLFFASYKEAKSIIDSNKGFYSYYRKMYPLLNIKSRYLAVIKEYSNIFNAKFSKDLFADIESELEKISQKVKSLQIPSSSYTYFDNGEKKECNGRRRRRIWGSGFEMSTLIADNLPLVSFGIISYNFDHFLVFSKNKIKPGVEYYANGIKLNCIDFPLAMKMEFDKEKTDKIMIGIKNGDRERIELSEILQELQVENDDISLYILSKKSMDFHQEMYFKTICLEQIELEKNLSPKFYKEVFCQ